MNSVSRKFLRWGILSTGRIAGKFAEGVQESQTGILAAVASRTQQAASDFAARFGIPQAHPTYEALLKDPNVDVVYIATPHPFHAQWAIAAARAKKHVLCEKPITMNAREAAEVIEAARANRVFLMEAFMYRCHPQTARLVELIRAGAIGAVRSIQATFSFHAERDLRGRVLAHELGGGGILDVGCYCMSMARLVAGVAQGQPFAEPTSLRAIGHVGEETRVDEFSCAIAEFPGGIQAQLACGCQLQQDNVVRIYGTEGWLLIPRPWVISPTPGISRMLLHSLASPEPQVIETQCDLGIFAVEADAVANNLALGQVPHPAMTWNDTLCNMRALDAWRQAIGLHYDMES